MKINYTNDRLIKQELKYLVHKYKLYKVPGRLPITPKITRLIHDGGKR